MAVTKTNIVGPDHAVLEITHEADNNAYRKSVCRECPWRKDAPIGEFPIGAYRHSARTAYDGAFITFACHMSGSERTATCAGFLLQNSINNIAVRMRHIDPEMVEKPDVELYANYREMAIANGVDPDDPALAPCRADDEWRTHAVESWRKR